MSVNERNTVKLPRKFLNNNDVSKHLLCIICQDLFDEPKRLNCGHTFCESCILTWTKENLQCPICKTKIIKKMMARDLIAFNIINDMLVACGNQGCPWKSKLSDLKSHMNVCQFDEKRLPQNVKKLLFSSDENSEVKKELLTQLLEEENEEKNNYFSFNNRNGSLKSRLFSKAPEMMKKVLEAEEKGVKKTDDILSFLNLDSVVGDNTGNDEENINKIESNKNMNTPVNNISNIQPVPANSTSRFTSRKRKRNNRASEEKENYSLEDKEAVDSDIDEESLFAYAISLSMNEFNKKNNN